MDLTKIRLELDFLWSIRLGASLRVYSIGEPYTYTYHLWSKCGQYLTASGKRNTAPCPASCGCFLNDPVRYTFSVVYQCAAHECVIGNPDINGGSKFWVLPIAEVQQQINQGKLLLNNIPTNWSQLKNQANPLPLHKASDGELLEHLKEFIKEK